MPAAACSRVSLPSPVLLAALKRCEMRADIWVARSNAPEGICAEVVVARSVADNRTRVARRFIEISLADASIGSRRCGIHSARGPAGCRQPPRLREEIARNVA